MRCFISISRNLRLIIFLFFGILFTTHKNHFNAYNKYAEGILRELKLPGMCASL